MPDYQPLVLGDPSQLGQYEIIGRLGEGGQGIVYLGRRAGQHVAIKLLHARLSSDPAARSAFMRELQVATRVARFCTAQVLDADLALDSQPYIVSEFVEGRSLRDLVEAEGPRAGGALDRLAVNTLTALSAIHQVDVVHRDFKPHNVLMGPDGPRVIDFGIAGALGGFVGDIPTIPGGSQTAGSPAYMAPEQVRGEKSGPASDMFAWAATIVFAATGRAPFGNDEVMAVFHRILTAEPDLSQVSGPLRGVLEACLAKDAESRPTAAEAQQMLMSGAPHTPDQTARNLPRSPGGRRTWIALTAAAVTTAALVAVPVWLTTRGDEDPIPAAAAHPSKTPMANRQPDEPVEKPNRRGGSDELPTAKSETSVRPNPTPSTRPSQSLPQPTSPQPPPPEPRNPYSAAQACNADAPGSGYKIQRSTPFNGGHTYQLYAGGYNCVVTLKTKNVGKRTTVTARLFKKSGGGDSDSGPYKYYAVAYAKAGGTCVRYSGGVTGFGGTGDSIPWANCG